MNKILVKFFLLVLFTLGTFGYAQKYWAAAYIDLDTGIAGVAYNASSREEAETHALRSCKRKHGKKKSDCRKAGSFYNGCGAIYWGNNAIQDLGLMVTK